MLRSCRNSQKLRKDVVDSHRPLRGNDVAPPAPESAHHVEKKKSTVQIFGGRPHPLPKPQPSGQPVPLPLAARDQGRHADSPRISTASAPEELQEEVDPIFPGYCNISPTRPGARPDGPPPPPAPVSSPSSSGKGSPAAAEMMLGSKTTRASAPRQENPSPAHECSSSSTTKENLMIVGTSILDPLPPPPSSSSTSSSSSALSLPTDAESSPPWCPPPIMVQLRPKLIIPIAQAADQVPPPRGGSLSGAPSSSSSPPLLLTFSSPQQEPPSPSSHKQELPPLSSSSSSSLSATSSWGYKLVGCRSGHEDVDVAEEVNDYVSLLNQDVRVFGFDDIERCAGSASSSPHRRNDVMVEELMGDVCVFMAWVGGGADRTKKSMVAVVRESYRSFQQGSTTREWVSKVNLISQVQDRHVCKLKGILNNGGYHVNGTDQPRSISSQIEHQMLVYEHSSHGILSDYLFGSLCKALLDWRTRMRIALAAARGLAYIHDIAPVEVVYRDLKSSNILLDEDFGAKLVGYGLDVISRGDNKLAQASSKVLKKSQALARRNIRSFGVLLLELLTGKYSKGDEFSKDENVFVQWAKPYLLEHHDKLVQILDPHLRRHYPCTGMRKAAEIALQCVRKDPKRRLSASELVDALEATVMLPPLNNFNNKKILFMSDLKRCRSLKKVHHFPLNFSRSNSNKV